jgi:hypothetical protein
LKKNKTERKGRERGVRIVEDGGNGRKKIETRQRKFTIERKGI